MASHSSILSWQIPWTEEPGRLQSMGSQRAGHNGTQEHSSKRLNMKIKQSEPAEAKLQIPIHVFFYIGHLKIQREDG